MTVGRVFGLVSIAVLGLAVLPASAQVSTVTRVKVTDPGVLQRMGFPANADNVYVAQSSGPDVSAPEDFGTGAHVLALAPKTFMPRQDTDGINPYSGGQEGCCTNITPLVGSDTFWDAPITVASGVLLTAVRLYANDSSAGSDIDLFIFEGCHGTGGVGGPTVYTLLGQTSTTGTGNQSPIADLTDTTVDNQNCQYTARVNFGSLAGDQTLQRVRVGFARQVTPTPGFATFTDVPVGHPFHRFVQALVSSGITGGCGGSNYCPNDPVTRGQMAVFLASALGLYWF